MEVDVAFVTPILDTLACRVASRHRRLRLGLIIEGGFLFGIVLVSNALIGIVQEYRAKRTLDRAAALPLDEAPKGPLPAPLALAAVARPAPRSHLTR